MPSWGGLELVDAMLVSPPRPDKVRKSFWRHPPRFRGLLAQNAQIKGTMYTSRADVSDCKSHDDLGRLPCHRVITRR